MKNAINWFEIPVTNYERAKKFYESLLDVTITDLPMDNMKYGMLPHDMENQGVGGAIIEFEMSKPSEDGCTVYLNGGEDLSVSLSKVEGLGGSILMPKTEIGENGYIAQFKDTEGNRVALHSMN